MKANTFLTLLCLFLATTSLKAQTVLPSFATADDFGGQTIGDLTSFVPTTNNFTLEVQATAATPVTIAFGSISYTPTADSSVRFVQQDGKVYVFENNTYATTLTPDYIYNKVGEQLLRNPSFETVGEELTSGRWKATEWETWNGGTPTWGGDVGYVNVRENASYRSDGTKSIILHTGSRWLSQQLTADALAPATTYLLTYDYWTSSGTGNGGITYHIQLGSSLANNDLLDLEGHTPTNANHAKHSFATVFQTPATLPDDLYLSLYRPESKVDWLDNMSLTAISPVAAGITGAASAVYATGAYAPACMMLPGDVYIDQTSRLANPNFDDNLTGWTLTASTQSKISTVEKGGGIIADNQNHWQLWQASGALTGKAYQTVTGLPNGKYHVEATVVTTSFGGVISLYANDGKTAIASNTAQRYVTTGIVTDGTLELGLDLATTGGVTVDFDTFTLHYLGMDADGYREVLNQRIAEAKAILDHLEAGYDAAPLNTAVANAEVLGTEATAEELIAAIAELNAAMNDYAAYVAEREAERARIAAFAAAVEAARAERAADEYPDAVAFDEAITTAAEYLAQLQTNYELAIVKYESEKDALNAAREAYYNSQFTITPRQQTISYVDLTLNGSEKFVLRVDGRPYYATEIQLRPDKLRGYEGWSEPEIEAVFKRAADDGFSTVSVPLFWSEVEPEKNHFDWRILDEYLGWCKKYGMKMELLWFSWSSGGRVQYLWNYNGQRQLRTPDYVCSMEGTSEYNMLRTEWEYSLDWRDTNLRDRETYVLGRVMEHVALWDANNGAPHTVVGVQLGNEACTHGGNTATDAEIIDWYHHVGAAVKQSKYVTWTRLNCISWMTSGRTNANESRRNNGGTNIDFVGIDIYGTNAPKVKGNMDGYLGTNGKNYRMIMEIDAKDSNAPLYQMAALAGDKAFDYYNMGPVDGNGLYANTGHVLTERSHINLVRQRNKIINADAQDIALKKQGSGLYVYNYAGNSTATETGILSIAYTPANATSQAIVINRSSYEVVLLSTGGGTFDYPASLGVEAVEQGYFDASNQWVSEGAVNYTSTSITLGEATCVRLSLSNESALTEALAAYDAAVSQAARYEEANYPYASGKRYAYMQTLAAASRPTTAASAADATAALWAAIRDYVTSNAQAEHVGTAKALCPSVSPTETTLLNPNAEATSGWTIAGFDVNSNDAMAYVMADGTTIPTRFNKAWTSSPSTSSVTQTLPALSAGRYLLSVAARGDIRSLQLNGAAATYHNLSTFGTAPAWDDAFVVFTQEEDGPADISAAVNGTWFSLTNFRLTRLSADLTATPTADIENAIVRLPRSLSAGWNAVVFPFNMTTEQISAAFGDEAEVRTLNTALTLNGSSATIAFDEATATEAGVPFVLRLPTTGSNYYIEGVNISTDAPSTVVASNGSTSVTLQGTYDGEDLSSDFHFLNGTTLYHHTDCAGAVTAQPFSAWFTLETTAEVKLTVNLSDTDTGVEKMVNSKSVNRKWFDLSGRSVTNPSRGIYILKGKKVIVK